MSIYSEIKPEVRMFADMCVENSRIDPELYLKYDVKRGLRDLNGKGVLTGLTNISEIISSKTVDGKSVPCEGELYYRGYSVEELVRRQLAGDHFGYERTAYLLLFGELPDEEHFKTFCELLSFYRTLPTSFVRDIIMKAPSSDMMNTLARSVLTLYSYDRTPSSPRRRTSCAFCGRTAPTPSWRPGCWTLPSSSTRTTAAATTPPLPPTWSPPPARTPTPPSPRPWAP